MRKAIAILIVFGGCSSAVAADLPLRNFAQESDATVAYRWAGLYVGGNAGFVWGSSNWAAPDVSTGRFDLSGFSLSGTVGYNYQLDHIVVGVEGDFGWANTHGSTTTNCLAGCETKSDWLSTVRGRLGFGTGRFLPFVSGGVAFAGLTANSPGQPGLSKVATGWVAGFGAEYALTENWSAKAEYIYIDFGNVSCGANCGIGIPVNVPLTEQQVRLGLTFRFPISEPLLQTAVLEPGPKGPCKPDPDDPGPLCGTSVAKKAHKKPPKDQKNLANKGVVNTSMRQ